MTNFDYLKKKEIKVLGQKSGLVVTNQSNNITIELFKMITKSVMDSH